MTNITTTIDDILATLDTKTKTGITMANDISKEFLPTASFGINQEIGGGFRLGHQHTVYGQEGSAKTAFMLETVGINQARGVPCVWYDAEGVFDPEWAERLGVDTSKLIVRKFSSISKVADDQVMWIDKGVRLIVIDSTSELMQTSLIDGEEVKDFDDTKQQGTQAKDLGKMSKMVQSVNFTCAIVHISQVRMNLGAATQQKPMEPVGGKEIRHNDSIKIRLTGTRAVDKQILGEIQQGDMLIERQIGYPVVWKVEKNRLNGNEGHGTYNFYKKGDRIGIDRMGEVLNAGIEYGLVIKTNSWYKIGDKQVQGDKKMVAYLRDNPELYDKLRDDVIAKSI